MILETGVGAFLSALAKVYRASPNTVAAYRGDLTAFSRFLVTLRSRPSRLTRSASIWRESPTMRRAIVGWSGVKRFFRHLEITRRLDNPTRRMHLPNGTRDDKGLFWGWVHSHNHQKPPAIRSTDCLAAATPAADWASFRFHALSTITL